MFDDDFYDKVAAKLQERLEKKLAKNVADELKDKGLGTRQEYFNRAAIAGLLGISKQAVDKMISRSTLPIPSAPLGGVDFFRKSDVEKLIAERMEYVRDRINIRKETERMEGPQEEEDDMWMRLVNMFNDYLPPVPRSAFIDEAAHTFYKKYRQEMLMEACIDPFGDTMSKVMDEIKEAVTEANREEAEKTQKGNEKK
jgi:predicted DNA-binding transcriptional regulator AlpA